MTTPRETVAISLATAAIMVGVGGFAITGPLQNANGTQNARLDRIEHQLHARPTTPTTLSPDLTDHPPCVFDDTTCAGIARAVRGLNVSCRGRGYVVSVELKTDGTREVTGHCFK